MINGLIIPVKGRTFVVPCKFTADQILKRGSCFFFFVTFSPVSNKIETKMVISLIVEAYLLFILFLTLKLFTTMYGKVKNLKLVRLR